LNAENRPMGQRKLNGWFRKGKKLKQIGVAPLSYSQTIQRFLHLLGQAGFRIDTNWLISSLSLDRGTSFPLSHFGYVHAWPGIRPHSHLQTGAATSKATSILRLQIDADSAEIDASVAQALIDRERDESRQRPTQISFSKGIGIWVPLMLVASQESGSTKPSQLANSLENDWEDDFLVRLVPNNRIRLTSSVLEGSYGEEEDFLNFSIEWRQCQESPSICVITEGSLGTERKGH